VTLAAAALLGSVSGASAIPPIPFAIDVNMSNQATNDRELNIVVDPLDPDHLAAGANMRGGPNGQRWYISTDGGRTWTTGQLPYGTIATGTNNTTNTLMSDPALDFDSEGDIYYSALAHGGSTDPCDLFVSTTADNGTTWSDPANGLIADGGADTCHDKQFILVDRANNDNVYVAWTPFGPTNDQEVVFSRDLGGNDDGFAFSAQLVLSTDPAQGGCLNHGAELAQEADGDLYVAWVTLCSGFADGDDGSIWVARSTDLGQNFGAPVQVATLDNVTPNVATGFRARSFPSIDADPTTGRLFVAWADYVDSDGGDADILLSTSIDNGAWTTPVTVSTETDTDTQVMPWVTVGQNRVSVAYYSLDNTGTGPTNNWNTILAYGAVAASPTFSLITVTSAGTPAATGFIGDYLGAIAGSDQKVHVAWGDGRAGVGGATDGFYGRVDFSPPQNVSAVAVPSALPWGESTTITATVTGASSEAEEHIPVGFTVSSTGSPSPSTGSGTTDAAGQAAFTYSNGNGGTDTVTVWADMDENGTQDAGETTTVDVTWQPHPTQLVNLGPAFFGNGDTVTVSATLEDILGAPVPVVGRSVTFTLGSGASAQSCTDPATDAAGLATCDIVDVNQPIGPNMLQADFAGDSDYVASTVSRSVVIFTWTPGGNFVIGDGNDTVGGTATFWSDEWYLANSVSGGQAPMAFKGFSNTPSGATMCGLPNWSSRGGNSPPPAGAVPEYTAVLVTDLVTKTGRTISGTKPSIVVVRVNPGYAPNPGKAGTAEILGVLCP